MPISSKRVRAVALGTALIAAVAVAGCGGASTAKPAAHATRPATRAPITEAIATKPRRSRLKQVTRRHPHHARHQPAAAHAATPPATSQAAPVAAQSTSPAPPPSPAVTQPPRETVTPPSAPVHTNPPPPPVPRPPGGGGIPQHNGGDMDGDNNGAPSDGDGGI
jgi:hypothetical protein